MRRTRRRRIVERTAQCEGRDCSAERAAVERCGAVSTGVVGNCAAQKKLTLDLSDGSSPGFAVPRSLPQPPQPSLPAPHTRHRRKPQQHCRFRRRRSNKVPLYFLLAPAIPMNDAQQ